LHNEKKDFESLKLIDFGTSIEIKDDGNLGYVGTPNYMAPEVV